MAEKSNEIKKGGVILKKISKLFLILIAVFMIVPGLAQAAKGAEGAREIIKRLEGKDRVETAVAVSKEVYKDGANTVILAGYEGEIDALTGTLLAAAKDAPLLLVRKNGLDRSLQDEIKRLGSKKIYILGGEKVISGEVENVLKRLNIKTKRLAGENRAETAIKIAQEVKDDGFIMDHVFLAEGYNNLVDALVVGPVSATRKTPVFLTKTYGLPEETKEALKILGVKKVTMLGGEKAISKEIENGLKESGYKIEDRLSGSNRYETAVKVAEKFFNNSSEGIIARGEAKAFADSIVGGYLGANKNAPILLSKAQEIERETQKFTRENLLKAYILGGEKAISKSVEKEVETAVKDLDIVVDTNTSLDKYYKRVRVVGDNAKLNLDGNTIKILEIEGKNNQVKNGQATNINIGKDSRNISLEDIKDNGQGQHDIAGGGEEGVTLKGDTNLKSPVKISSDTPVKIKEEGLKEGQGIKGKLIIDTGAQVTIATPVAEVEVNKNNKSIKIQANIGKITAGEDIKAEYDRTQGIEKPAIEEGQVSEKEPTATGPTIRPVSGISVTGDLVYGSTLTATPEPSNTTGTYQWKKSDSADGTYVDIDGASQKTYTLSSEDTGKFLKVEVIGTGIYKGKVTSIATEKITPIILSVTATANNKTYDGTADTTGSIALSGVLSGETVTATGTFAFDNKNVGTDKTVNVAGITLAGADQGNYRVNDAVITTSDIAPKTLVATARANNRVYDGTVDATGDISLSGVLSGETVIATGTFAFDNKDVGTGKTVNVSSVILTGDDAGNYGVNDTVITTAANITKKELTATATGAGKVYDGNTIGTGSIVLEGVVGSEKVTATGTFTFDNKNAGTDKTVTVADITLGGVGKANYTVNDTATTTNITPKPAEIIVDNPTIKYGSAYPTFGGTVSGLIVPGDLGTITYKEISEGKNSDGHLNVNDDPYTDLTAEYTTNDNYTVTIIPGTLTVTRKEVTITAASETFTYDGNSKSSSSAVVVGLVGKGESITPTVVGSITYPTKSPVVNEVKTYTTSLTNENNYIINKVNGELRMEKANIALTITADGDERVYNGNPLTKNTYQCAGSLGTNDILEVTITGTITNVGNVPNKITHVKVKNNSTIDVTENYNITTKSGSLVVKPATIVITAGSSEKVYDGNPLKNEYYTINGAFITGQGLASITINSAITNVGSTENKITGHTLNANTLVENYIINYVDGNLTVNKANQAAPTGLQGVKPTTYFSNDGKITGTNIAMEYKLSSASENDWKIANETEVTGLSAGTYYVRYKATENYNASLNATVTVNAGANVEQSAPTGLEGISPTVYGQENGKITGTTALMEYKKSESGTYIKATETETIGLVAGDYYVRYAARTGYNFGADTKVVITVGANAQQSAPTGLTVVPPSKLFSYDGKIEGTTSEMAYRILGGNNLGTPEGLRAGVYEVWYKAKEGFDEGIPAEIILLPPADGDPRLTEGTLGGKTITGDSLNSDYNWWKSWAYSNQYSPEILNVTVDKGSADLVLVAHNEVKKIEYFRWNDTRYSPGHTYWESPAVYGDSQPVTMAGLTNNIQIYVRITSKNDQPLYYCINVTVK